MPNKYQDVSMIYSDTLTKATDYIGYLNYLPK